MAGQRGMKQLRLWERELAALEKRKIGVTESVVDAMVDFLSGDDGISIPTLHAAKGDRVEDRKAILKDHLRSIVPTVRKV